MNTDTDINVVEGNRIIAEFDGKECSEDKNEHMRRFDDDNLYFPEHLKYHSSWDWLMPVVGKIESIGFAFTISQQYCNIQDGKTNVSITGVMYAPNKKEVVYNAVIEFLKFRQTLLK